MACTGGVQKPQKKNLVEDPKGTLGISESGFGFTKKNEVGSWFSYCASSKAAACSLMRTGLNNCTQAEDVFCDVW